jgi:hypothetical protein
MRLFANFPKELFFPPKNSQIPLAFPPKIRYNKKEYLHNPPYCPKGFTAMNKSASKAKNKQTEPAAPTPAASPAPTPTAILRDLWLGTCARYTVLCLILLVTSAIASASLTVTYVDTVRFFLLLPFGLCLTLAAWVRKSDKLSAGAKCALHPLAFLSGFYFFCYLPYQIRTTPSGM